VTSFQAASALLRMRVCCLCVVWCVVLAGCASGGGARQQAGEAASHWEGRLAINVTHPETKAFAASFELQGNAELGQLTLTTPLGTTLAKINWTADAAFLTTSGPPQRFDSLQTLALRATGVDIPIAQLCDWFVGTQSAANGWAPDLRGFDTGRIAAKRSGPDLQAELKILLER